ncbi:hypothetical protein [Kitasatospora sp. NPDC008115]|uniref:hypothetical protein n=1 Tax=Kitasatospora sp. NPDC008115 TaxID=3364022 RepID=UPI0036E0BB1A
MRRSSGLHTRLRITAVALAASACLLGGAASAQATPAAATPAAAASTGVVSTAAASTAAGSTGAASVSATEMAKFMGSGTGGSMGSAIESAANVAYVYAQSAGWQRSQCYLLGSEVRSTGFGWFTAVAQVFCQR